MAVDNLSRAPSDGTAFGQSVSDKIAFYGITPIVQPSGSTQAAAGTTASTTTTPAGFATTTQANNLINLVDAMRSALVNLGLIKGA
jgi:hypothetical protein